MGCPSAASDLLHLWTAGSSCLERDPSSFGKSDGSAQGAPFRTCFPGEQGRERQDREQVLEGGPCKLLTTISGRVWLKVQVFPTVPD